MGQNQPIRILMVCHGNVCRSTMAQFVLQHLVDERGLTSRFVIDSAATSREEIGNDVHRGTRKKLAEKGIPCGHHRARQMTAAEYGSWDYIIGMDAENLDGMYRILLGETGYGWSWKPVSSAEIGKADPEGKVHLLLDWSSRPRDIADPWYTGNFDATFRDVWEGCTTLLEHLVG